MQTDRSLDSAYFEGIFAGDADPWGLATSAYETAKFAHSIRVLSDRRYDAAIEIGCAHGVLTEQLAGLCDDLLAIDIAEQAIDRARERCRDRKNVRFARMAFPAVTSASSGFDLAVLSEVAYYWSDADLDRAARWLRGNVQPAGRILLVHWIGDTDYPQTGDAATEKLELALGDAVLVEHSERTDRYRLDLWSRA